MASYVVMEPPQGDAERAVLVRDGFHVLALVLPVVWLLVHRLWLETLAFVAAALLLGTLTNFAGLGPAGTAASLLLALYVGMEGAALKLAALRRRGWREWGVVEAANSRDAEICYLAEVASDERDEKTAAVSSAVAPQYRQPSSGPALGLLAYPGRG